MNKKNLLVTGGAGFIGSSFVIDRVNAGDDVVVYDLFTYSGHSINLESVKGKCKIIRGDIKDANLLLNILKENKIDILINFAAESHVDNSIKAPNVFIETNIIGTYNLLASSLEYYNNLDLEKKKNFKYIQISTDEVYGSLGDTGKFSEDSNIQPNSPYSASKASGDLLCRAWYETYGLPVIVTNCSNNYGPRQLPEKLIPVVIFSCLNNRVIPVYGNGENIRDWIHVEDHVNGINLAIEHGKFGQTYCLGGDSEVRNIDLVKNICEILDELSPRDDKLSYKAQIKFVQDRLGHDKRYAIDDSKAQKELNFTRKYDFNYGLRQTIEWYLNNQNWYENVTEKLNQGDI